MRRKLSVPRPDAQRGMVLVSSMLLLLVITIMALSMFRSFGVQERIAGNLREKQRAVQAAISTQQYAEWWLINQSGAPQAVANTIANALDVPCGTTQVAAVSPYGQAQGQICLNALGSPTSVPYASGVSYTPPNMTLSSQSATLVADPDAYPVTPGFYIADLGTVASGRGEVYQIDAYSYGLTSNTVAGTTVAVVQSTVQITCLTCNPGGL